jgi:hypothetical protein
MLCRLCTNVSCGMGAKVEVVAVVGTCFCIKCERSCFLPCVAGGTGLVNMPPREPIVSGVLDAQGTNSLWYTMVHLIPA